MNKINNIIFIFAKILKLNFMFVTKNKLAFLLFLTATIWINVAHAQSECTPTITVDGEYLG